MLNIRREVVEIFGGTPARTAGAKALLLTTPNMKKRVMEFLKIIVVS
jgi:hypothetical protein